MVKNTVCFFLFFAVVIISMPACAADNPTKNLELFVSSPGNVLLEGDFSENDSIRLYSREYRSDIHLITERLILETTADTDHSVMLRYSIYADPLSVTEIVPDFDYHGRDVYIKSLYAVVSDGRTEESEGLSLYEMAEFLQSIGVKTAYNLDGGSSVRVLFNGQAVDSPYKNTKSQKRRNADMIYFASAWQE